MHRVTFLQAAPTAAKPDVKTRELLSREGEAEFPFKPKWY